MGEIIIYTANESRLWVMETLRQIFSGIGRKRTFRVLDMYNCLFGVCPDNLGQSWSTTKSLQDNCKRWMVERVPSSNGNKPQYRWVGKSTETSNYLQSKEGQYYMRRKSLKRLIPETRNPVRSLKTLLLVDDKLDNVEFDELDKVIPFPRFRYDVCKSH